jgi:Rab GDP dissociation inhibitor
MDEEYDTVILGTGLKQCLLMGALSVISGKKVLLLDKNGYYGGSTPTLNLQQLFEHFGKSCDKISKYGGSRNWNVDMIPKVLMANGALVQLLVKTGVLKCLDFKVIGGHYNYKATGLRRSSYVEIDVSDVFGDSISPQENKDNLNESCSDTMSSDRRYSFTFVYPFVYPLFGLACISDAVSRISSVCGGTVMLQQHFSEVLFGDDGKVAGVTCEGSTFKCKNVIADQCYFPERFRKAGQVVRAICLLQNCIPNTHSSKSCRIVIPGKNFGRENDIYVVGLSCDHNVCDKNWYVATVSTTVETDKAEEELEPGIKLLGSVSEKFVSVSDLYEPLEDGRNDNIFLCSSYDATPDLGTTSLDILSIFENCTGEPLELSDHSHDISENSG